MLRTQENTLSMQFRHINNRSMLWNLLRETYGTQSLIGFEEQFEKIVEGIANAASNFINLIEMNKACVATSANNINPYRRDKGDAERIAPPKDTRQVSKLNSNFAKKQDEFNNLINDPKPSEINFEVTEKQNFNGNISDLMSQQQSERNSDMMEITQTYNKRNAQNWINNEVPPPLSIGHNDKTPQVTVDPLPPQRRVTFNLPNTEGTQPTMLMPRGRARSPPPPPKVPEPVNSSFLHKLKKISHNDKSKINVMTPYKIEDGSMFFSDFDNLIKSFCVSKLFIHNATVRTENALKQVIESRLSDDLFLLCDIGINQRPMKNGVLLFKKNDNAREVCYESTEFIEVAENIKEMALTFSNKNNEQLDLSPSLDVELFVKGRSLHIKSQDHMSFYDNKFGYIVLKDGLLGVGEKILINNDITTVIGTCLINKQEDFYHLMDTDMLSGKEHNCAIVKWNVDNRGKLPTIHRLPTLRVVSTTG